MQTPHSTDQIWQIVDSRSYGGIESHILYLSKALAEQNRNVSVVFLNDYGVHPLEYKLRENGIHFEKCQGTLEFMRKVRASTPLLMHSHGYKANLVSRLAGLRCGVPTISTYHAGDCETLKLKLYTTLDRVSAFLGKPVAVNSQIARTLTGHAEVIDNFVSLPPYFDAIEHIRDIGFAGRLSHEKAPDRFLDLAKRFPDIRFHVFGDGPMGMDLKDSASANVKFYGHMRDMEKAWKAIDILCMPSRKEGLPMAALEAMARGIPVLAYGAGALPKLIEHGQNGWLVDLPCEKATCTADMEAILRSIRLPHAQRCAHQARETIKAGYSQQALIPKFLSLYDQITAEKTHTLKGGVYATQ